MNIKAFTLFEIIITLILFSFVAVMIMPYYQSGVLAEHKPIDRLQISSVLNESMELVVNEYDYSTKKAAALTTLITHVQQFSTYYCPTGSPCAICSPTITNPYTVGVGAAALTTAALVEITCSGSSEKLSHVFTATN